jgi:PAS domain-containing protein
MFNARGSYCAAQLFSAERFCAMIEFLKATDNGTQLSVFSGVDDRFRAIFDSVYDGIFISDSKTNRFIEINEPSCRMFGYERAELTSGNIGTLSSGVHLYTADLALQHADRARL